MGDDEIVEYSRKRFKLEKSVRMAGDENEV